MPPLWDLLRRLRIVRPPPGAPPRLVGVPAPRAETPEAELRTLLTGLTSIEDDERVRVARAATLAHLRLRAAEGVAREITDSAERHAAVVRERAERVAREGGAEDARAVLAEADAEVERLRAVGDERLAAVVRRVVECVEQGAR